MMKVIGSREDFNPSNEDVAEFLSITKDILTHPEFLKLKNYTHHIYTTRYQHCLDVAWYAYKWSKKKGLNYVSCTRGALLHDFYLYDPRKGEQPLSGRHAEVHPVIALATAEKYFDVDPIMADCIVHHMWPNARVKPVTKEGLIVVRADEYCASIEWSSLFISHMYHKIHRHSMTLKGAH